MAERISDIRPDERQRGYDYRLTETIHKILFGWHLRKTVFGLREELFERKGSRYLYGEIIQERWRSLYSANLAKTKLVITRIYSVL